MKRLLIALVLYVFAMLIATSPSAIAQEGNGTQVHGEQAAVKSALSSGGLTGALIDGDGPGWVTLVESDFRRVNCFEDTFRWDGAVASCTGKPVGVLASKTVFKNIEIVAEWRHLSLGGNSGFFLWTPAEALEGLEPGQLPKGGIEIQMLDHGFTDNYVKRTGKKPDWFTTNGDIFAVGKSTMKPFEPLSPNGSRSFPREQRSLGSPAWNHYYIRGINGEVRLWVNGKEVSGGRDCNPSEGYLCLESEGAPIEWRNIRVRTLP